MSTRISDSRPQSCVPTLSAEHELVAVSLRHEREGAKLECDVKLGHVNY